MRHEHAKLQQLVIKFCIAIFMFALGVVAAALWIRHDSSLQRLVLKPKADFRITARSGEESPLSWQKIDMNGEVSFYIPPGLRPVIEDTPHLYTAFRNDTMKIFMSYDTRNKNAKCIVPNDDKAISKSELIRINVGATCGPSAY